MGAHRNIKQQRNVRIAPLQSFPLHPALCYVCENWCVTLRKEYGLEVFENWVLRYLYLRDGRPRPRWKSDIKLVLKEPE
jgi:hypothetical protein